MTDTKRCPKCDLLKNGHPMCTCDTTVSDLAGTNSGSDPDVTNPPTPDTKALREDAKEYLEANLLDGDKIQAGQMIASTEILEVVTSLITSKVIEELEGLNKRREYPVKNHGLVKDTEGREFEAIQTATDSWENTIKLRIKELNNTLKKQGE